MMPEVSVIMPAYNAAKFIAESIDSVINQTYSNWELIIVDDGSTDDTAAMVRQYQSTDSRIHYLYQANGRQGKARNTGIKNSNGCYIAFLDADDLWTVNKLQLQVDLLNAQPAVDLIFSQGYLLMPNGAVQDYNVKIKEWTVEKDGDEFIDWNQVPILSVIVKKEAIKNAGMFCEDMSVQNAEDYHLWLKLLFNGCRFLSTTDRLFYYRIHSSQITYQNQNLYKAITNVYYKLVEEGVISNTNKALHYRVKWFIINHIDLKAGYKNLRLIFPKKKRVLSFCVLLDSIMPANKLTKRMLNRFL